MAVRLRLQRLGRKKRPFYRMVVAESTSPRGGKSIEIVGTYDPTREPVHVAIKEDRVKHWLSVGVELTEPVERLLANEGLISKVERKSKFEGLSKEKRKELKENGGRPPKEEAPEAPAEEPKAEEAPVEEAPAEAATEEAPVEAPAEEAKAEEAPADGDDKKADGDS